MEKLKMLDGFQVYQHNGVKLVPLREYEKLKIRSEEFRNIIQIQHDKIQKKLK